MRSHFIRHRFMEYEVAFVSNADTRYQSYRANLRIRIFNRRAYAREISVWLCASETLHGQAANLMCFRKKQSREGQTAGATCDIDTPPVFAKILAATPLAMTIVFNAH
jgi:hypothetical protein